MDERGAVGERGREKKRDERREEERERVGLCVESKQTPVPQYLSLTRICSLYICFFSMQYIREDAAQAKKSYEDKYQSKVSDDHYFLSIVT